MKHVYTEPKETELAIKFEYTEPVSYFVCANETELAEWKVKLEQIEKSCKEKLEKEIRKQVTEHMETHLYN